MTADEHAWIDRFVAHLELERRVSEHTAAAYRRDLERLRVFCGRRGIAAWSGVDNALIRSFAAFEHAGGLAPRSVQRRLSAVRTFFEYLIRERGCSRNPAIDVRSPKVKRTLP